MEVSDYSANCFAVEIGSHGNCYKSLENPASKEILETSILSK